MFIKKTQKYISTVKINRKSIHIGTFETLELAIEARDEKIKEIAKDLACLPYDVMNAEEAKNNNEIHICTYWSGCFYK